MMVFCAAFGLSATAELSPALPPPSLPPSKEIVIGTTAKRWGRIPSKPDSYSVEVGDTLVFIYPLWDVDVWSMPSSACDFAAAGFEYGPYKLADSSHGGGTGAGAANRFEYPMADVGTFYFASRTYCSLGQKITVFVSHRPPPPPPPPPTLPPPPPSPPRPPPPASPAPLPPNAGGGGSRTSYLVGAFVGGFSAAALLVLCLLARLNLLRCQMISRSAEPRVVSRSAGPDSVRAGALRQAAREEAEKQKGSKRASRPTDADVRSSEIALPDLAEASCHPRKETSLDESLRPLDA